MAKWKRMRAELRTLHPSLRWLQIRVWQAQRQAERTWLEAYRSSGQMTPREFRKLYLCEWPDA